jgi:hypothetical protein
MCQPGYRYPPYQNGPFKGEIIEKATREEYKINFDCIPVDRNLDLLKINYFKIKLNYKFIIIILILSILKVFQQVPLNIIESNTELLSFYRKKREITEQLFQSQSIEGVTSNSVDSIETLNPGALMALASLSEINQMTAAIENQQKASLTTKKADSFFRELLEKNLEKQEKTHSRKKRYAYEPTHRINTIFAAYELLASDYGRQNCFNFSESQRRLPGDVIYGVDTQFESQAKLALSIAHFLSSFYQIINTEEDYPLRNAERPISEDQLHAEVISAVAADFKTVGVGIFFDRNKFKKNKPFFGPYAFRNRDYINVEIDKHYQMVDLTGMPNGYINDDWFTVIY